MIGFPFRQRPAHLGPYPYEMLARDARLIRVESERAARSRAAPRPASGKPLARAAAAYQRMFAPLRAPQAVSRRAPVPDDTARRSVDIKGGAYFLDAAAVGICAMPGTGWRP